MVIGGPKNWNELGPLALRSPNRTLGNVDPFTVPDPPWKSLPTVNAFGEQVAPNGDPEHAEFGHRSEAPPNPPETLKSSPDRLNVPETAVTPPVTRTDPLVTMEADR